MKNILVCLYVFCCLNSTSGQGLIHAHNDYSRPRPLVEALESQAWSIEADVFLVKGRLLVGHSLKETSRRKTLQSLYINPIINLFKQHKGRISSDPRYSTHLVIDIKENGPEVLDSLASLFNSLRNYFDRSVNPMAVQIIISGDRGSISKWKDYPSFLTFDGRPYEVYDMEAIDKVAMISDNYFKYIETRTNRGDSIRIKQVVAKAKEFSKPVRFWGSPDNEATWKLLLQCGAEIINTDKPLACRKFLELVQ
jgi:Glycerophosphoryl diester phosphodiesterase family